MTRDPEVELIAPMDKLYAVAEMLEQLGEVSPDQVVPLSETCVKGIAAILRETAGQVYEIVQTCNEVES